MGVVKLFAGDGVAACVLADEIAGKFISADLVGLSPEGLTFALSIGDRALSRVYQKTTIKKSAAAIASRHSLWRLDTDIRCTGFSSDQTACPQICRRAKNISIYLRCLRIYGREIFPIPYAGVTAF